MSFFSPDPVFSAVYLTGIPEFNNKTAVNIIIRKIGIEVSIPFSKKKIITWDEIKKTSAETEGSIEPVCIYQPPLIFQSSQN